MKTAKKILQHNVNNFRHSVSLHRELYDKGMNSRSQFFMGIVRCLRERMKVFHWMPYTVLIISLYLIV